MTREKIINKLTNMILEGIAENSYSKIKNAFKECIEWNDNHPEKENCMIEDTEYIL